MYSVSAITSLYCAAGLLLLSTLPVAAQAPDSSATRPQGTLIKLGTGIVPPAFELSGYGGIDLPLILSAEHYLTPNISVYANAFTGFSLNQRYRIYDDSRESIIAHYGFDAGVRYYYNQEKRRQKGRATGPFVGNYVALQTSSVFHNNYYHEYLYSGVTAVWGMQRRMGKYGWFDGYVGLGVRRDSKYNSNLAGRGRYSILPELGVKFSLGSRLTH